MNKNKKLLGFTCAALIGASAYFSSSSDSASEAQVLPNLAEASLTHNQSSQSMPNSATSSSNHTPKTLSLASHRSTRAEDEELEQHYQADLSNPIERIKAIQHKTALHEALLKDHEQFTRYPEHNAKFDEPDRDPTTLRYELDERVTQNKEDRTALTLWSDQKYYLHNDTVTVFAKLQDVNGRIIPTQFAGQLIYDESVGLQNLSFTDTDLDGIHEVSFPLSTTGSNAFSAGLYKVLVVNNTNETADAITFTLSEPNLALSGNFRDQLKDGNLIIEAEVDVSEKNRYYFQASLYTETGSPIGSTQNTVELEKGKHWISLDFDGLLIRDRGEHGPFVLKNLSLAKVALPIQRVPLISPEYTTQTYQMEQFRNTKFLAANTAN